jgi:hypothetical protein
MTPSRLLTLASLLLVPTSLAACSDSVEAPGDSGSGAGSTGSGATTTASGDTTGSGGDAATSTTGGGTGGGFVGGDPLDTPKEAWTWVPFDDALCANGSTTGIGVNLTDKSKNVVIYMQGGGACWDALTCYLAQTAVNISSGYDEGNFDSDVTNFLSSSLFDRGDEGNPVKDYSFVFVPYCTGDVHSGDNVADHAGKETHHVGGANMTAYLERIVPTWKDADRVILSGSSAGGFGAGFNWWRIQKAFGDTRVDLIDDCGPPLPAPFLKESLEQDWRSAWSLDAGLPPDCPECLEDLDELFGYYRTHHTKNRAALLSYRKDQVISFFFQISESEVSDGLDALVDKHLSGADNFRYFFLAGNTHCTLQDPKSLESGGVNLQHWLQLMLDDSPEWTNVDP